jgi:hypothetical protein
MRLPLALPALSLALVPAVLGGCAPATQEGEEEVVALEDGKADGTGASADEDPSSGYPHRGFSPAGEPFVHGSRDRTAVDPSDVWQGGITDCWLIASMASVARANPWAIERLIRPRADGRYDVTLYFGARHWDDDGTVYRDPRVFVVAPTFPTKEDGTVAYAKPQDFGPSGPELWPLLLEKAYAQQLGRYEGDIPLLGRNLEYDVTPAFRQLLPRGDQTTYNLDNQSLDRIIEVLGNAFEEGRPATALVTSVGPVGATFAARYRIDTWHHYSIAKLDRMNRTIDLQDPRAGHPHPQNVPVEAFRAVFYLYTVGPPAI